MFVGAGVGSREWEEEAAENSVETGVEGSFGVWGGGAELLDGRLMRGDRKGFRRVELAERRRRFCGGSGVWGGFEDIVGCGEVSDAGVGVVCERVWRRSKLVVLRHLALVRSHRHN